MSLKPGVSTFRQADARRIRSSDVNAVGRVFEIRNGVYCTNAAQTHETAD